MDFAKTVLLFLSLIGFSIWVGAIMKAEGDDKLDVACAPVGFSLQKVQVVATGLVGYTPEWTFKARKVLEGGCYYFFSTFLFADEKGIGVNPEGGGIRVK